MNEPSSFTPSWRVDDRRDMAEDEYSEPGIAIGAELPEVGFVSVASVVYGCEEAKALGDQMDIAQRIVAALNGIHAGYINDLKNEIADLKARLSASSEKSAPIEKCPDGQKCHSTTTGYCWGRCMRTAALSATRTPVAWRYVHKESRKETFSNQPPDRVLFSESYEITDLYE